MSSMCLFFWHFRFILFQFREFLCSLLQNCVHQYCVVFLCTDTMCFQIIQTDLTDNIWSSVSLACSLCDKRFSSTCVLREHELTIHQKQFRFVCPVCGKGVTRRVALEGHMAAKHGMQKQFKCSICQRKFAYKKNLNDHLYRVHGVDLTNQMWNMDECFLYW